jgi:hypothetical protein
MPTKLFKPGQSGNPAGRKKGAKTKKSFYFEAVAACDRLGVNPFEILARIASGELLKIDGVSPEKIDAKLRMDAAAELCQYLAPKLKSIEHKGDIGEGFQLFINTVPFKPQENNHENEEESNEE